MKQIKMLVIFLIFAAGAAAEGELEGVWELVSGEYVDPKGELVDYQTMKMKSLKIISDSHFSFTSMKGDEFWASGTGKYDFKQGKYTEKLHYNSFGAEPGSEFSFDSKLEGEYWYNSRWDGDKRVEYEVWQRIE
ncbi:hypothetical protein [Lacimicrobium alkaliphilum]|uniref:Extracellular endo-alpha-(1->5)-L-arabinanase C-terminal domain-containing protein n=1 Tax=Lacimicrobium alkaliphilum TaxID=1526571 RepID=A0A0U3B8Q0_9ALTE|nr:hypothetical protein [Lacimicrobium alkaliphilum]ALS98053.1 hypothetical protein AT746_07105 [Lacimicrobium alkaliphilum]